MATNFENRVSSNQPSVAGLANRGAQNINQDASLRSNRLKDASKDAHNTSGLVIQKYNEQDKKQESVPIRVEQIEDLENIEPSSISKKQSQEISLIQSQDGGHFTQKPLVAATGSLFGTQPSNFQNTSELRRMLTNAVQPGSTFRAQLVFDKCGEYKLLGEGQGNIAYAIKRFSVAKTVYDLGILPNDMEPQKEAYLGRLTGNFMGSRFDLSDKPDSFSNLTIEYDASCSLQDRPVRTMKITHLKVASNGYSETSNFLTDNPKFDSAKNSWHMNLEGRANIGSVHNFRLINQKDRQKVFLLGKIRDGNYNIDVCHPMTPLQAFAIAVSSITYKYCSK